MRWRAGAVAGALALAACGPAASSSDGVASMPAVSPAASTPATVAPVDSTAASAEVAGLDGATLRGATGFDGGVLAVGSDGRGAAAWTSRDGVTWEPAEVEDAGAAQALEAAAFAGRGVTFGGDEAGGSPAWTSANGDAWRPVDATTGIEGRVNAVAVDGGRWVAAGDVVDEETGEAYRGAVWRSDDAASWELAAEVTLDEGTVSDVAVAGDTTVVVGFDVSGGKVWSATGDGEFDAVGGDEFAGVTIDGVANLGDAFVALGRTPDLRPVAWTSADGVTWTREDVAADAFAPDDAIHELASVDGGVMAVGVRADRGGVWTSPDGRSWTARS